mgnify:CR=1 FL=1
MIEQAQKMYEEATSLENNLEIISQQITELKELEKNLQRLNKEKEKEMLASFGKGIFIKTSLLDKELFVDVGVGVIVKKSISQVNEVIEEQTSRLMQMHEESKERLSDLQGELNIMLEKINNKGE